MPFNIAGGELLNLALNRSTYQIPTASSNPVNSQYATGMKLSQVSFVYATYFAGHILYCT